MKERVRSSLRVEQSLSQLLHEAFVSLRTLGKRSILALLGIVIGSSSVVALINIGHNAAEDDAETALAEDSQIPNLLSCSRDPFA
mgnify:CR=1 FL=1